MRRGLASSALARLARRVVVGSVRSKRDLALVHSHALGLDTPDGFDLAFYLGLWVAAWVAGYGMGYRRGVRDGIHGNVPKTDRQLSGD